MFDIVADSRMEILGFGESRSGRYIRKGTPEGEGGAERKSGRLRRRVRSCWELVEFSEGPEYSGEVSDIYFLDLSITFSLDRASKPLSTGRSHIRRTGKVLSSYASVRCRWRYLAPSQAEAVLNGGRW